MDYNDDKNVLLFGGEHNANPLVGLFSDTDSTQCMLWLNQYSLDISSTVFL